MTQPHLALTEAALLLVAHAEHEIPRATKGSAAPRITRDTLGFGSAPNQWPLETATIRLVSISESYVDSVLTHLTTHIRHSRDQLVVHILSEFEVSATRSWAGREQAFKSAFGIELTSMDGWTTLRSGRDVRNSIAHGLGRATPMQRLKSSYSKSLAELEAYSDSGRLVLRPQSVSLLARAVRRVLISIDAAVAAHDTR